MIQVTPYSFECNNFTQSAVAMVVRVVISPIRMLEDVTDDGRRETVFNYGCSHHYPCECKLCGFSRVSREEAKAKRKLDGNSSDNV